MSLIKDVYDACVENYFDDIKQKEQAISCKVKSFDELYLLEANQCGESVVLKLSDSRDFDLSPQAFVFLQEHGETEYPLQRKINSAEEIQDALDELQSAADDLLGFARDIAENRHTLQSAEAALQCNYDLRDTPQETSQLDSLAAEWMRIFRTLWYPSAGGDLRDLLFLSGKYPHIDIAPQLFIHTDCSPESADFDIDKCGVIFDDQHTKIELQPDREFDRLDLPRRQFASLDCANAGRIILYQVKIASDRFGEITRPLIYAVCENEWFAANVLAPNRIALDAVCHVRYGGGFGGALSNGAWLINTLRSLRAKYFISDPVLDYVDGDRNVLSTFPQLNGVPAELDRPITTINSRNWSGHGDVTIYELH